MTQTHRDVLRRAETLHGQPLPQIVAQVNYSKNTNGLSHNLLPLLVEAVVAPMRDGARRHGCGAIWCMLLACGVGCFVAPPRVGLHQVSPQRCRACLRVSLKNVSFWEVATTVANAANSTTGSYLKEVNRTATAFLQRRDAVDRDDAIANLCEQMQIKGRLCLVLGGKNLGKTLLKEKAIARCKAKANILSVNMREADMSGKDLMTALNLQRQKSLGWTRLLVEMLGEVIRFPVDYVLKRTSGSVRLERRLRKC